MSFSTTTHPSTILFMNLLSLIFKFEVSCILALFSNSRYLHLWRKKKEVASWVSTSGHFEIDSPILFFVVMLSTTNFYFNYFYQLNREFC